MQQSDAYYKELLSGFIQDSLTEEQDKELYELIRQDPQLYDRLMNEPQLVELVEQTAGRSEEELAIAADNRIREHILAYTHEKKVVHVYWNRWRTVAAAAVLIAGITTAILMVTGHKRNQIAQQISAPHDIAAPASNRAVITLADGSVIPLDSLEKGVLANQSAIRVVKLKDGQIAYEPNMAGTDERIIYNTLTNPRGSNVIDIGLSDGSHVWLNAGSSLTFPVAFNGAERKVSVNGEAYFEIAPDAGKPFLVNKGDMEITVLGTHFDVNAYDSEIRTTLLEGSVRVNKGIQEAILRPGQQALVDTKISIVNNVNVNQVVAWKNGFFNFENVHLREVMQQLERWYDITVVYEGTVPDVRFFGELRRDMNLSGIIAALHDSGVQFRVEGNKLIVLP
jgi:transmembrane sensor